MAQRKIPFKTQDSPMSVANLRLQSPIGQESLYGRLFGFGTKTGISLDDESAGNIRDIKNWSKTSKTYITYRTNKNTNHLLKNIYFPY